MNEPEQIKLNKKNIETSVIESRKGDALSGTWINDESGIILEIEEININDIILVKQQGGRYDEILIETIYQQEFDTFYINQNLSILEKLLNKKNNLLSLMTLSPEVMASRVSENVIEVANNGNAYVFIRDEYAEVPLSDEEKHILSGIAHEIALDDIESKNIIGCSDPNEFEGLPEWWTDEDTKKFFEELEKRVKEKISKMFDPEEQVKEKVLERIIEKAAAEIIAKKLAEREAKKAIAKKYGDKISKKEAERLAKRLASRLEKEYLYKHPNIMQRFNPLTKFRNIKKLIKSPKSWLRGRVARFLVKGLGKRVLAIPGLIDDLFTIGKAIYYGWKAQQAWEGAREQWRDAREAEERLEEFRESLSDEEKAKIEDLYQREKEYFNKTRNEHIASAKQIVTA